MVPEGLVLLTSVAFAAGVVRLGRRQALVQELPAVETLARVDVLCLDKTGTITAGDIAFVGLEPLGDLDEATIGPPSWCWPRPTPTPTPPCGPWPRWSRPGPPSPPAAGSWCPSRRPASGAA